MQRQEPKPFSRVLFELAEAIQVIYAYASEGRENDGSVRNLYGLLLRVLFCSPAQTLKLSLWASYRFQGAGKASRVGLW